MNTSKTKEVPAEWMCLYRNMQMSGGIFDDGYAFIEGVYPTFEDADKRAQEVVKLANHAPSPMIWVMRCVKTYTTVGVALSPLPGENK